jgi:hypothetical protein
MSVPTAISEMSSRIIPLKGRADFRGSSRILATETIRVLSCGVTDTQQKASGWSSRRAPLPATRPFRRRSPAFAGRHDLCHCLAAALACLQDDFEACITHLRFPLAHRQAIRTTNLLEQLFGEERRRTKVIPHAFGERAMLKLMYAASDPSGRTLARLAHERIRAPTADRHS